MTNTEIAITRTFDATPEQVFAAWTDPAQYGSWFSAGQGPSEEGTSIDLRVGGAWQNTMLLDPDKGLTKRFWGEYLEIDPPKRLVLTFTDDPDGHAIVTVDLAELPDGRTEMTFTQVGPLPADQVDAATQGWKNFFEQLAGLIAN